MTARSCWSRPWATGRRSGSPVGAEKQRERRRKRMLDPIVRERERIQHRERIRKRRLDLIVREKEMAQQREYHRQYRRKRRLNPILREHDRECERKRAQTPDGRKKVLERWRRYHRKRMLDPIRLEKRRKLIRNLARGRRAARHTLQLLAASPSLAAAVQSISNEK